MLNPNDEIRGRSLEAINHELQSEVQRFNERQEMEKQSQQNRKSNVTLKAMATLIVTQIVGK